MDRLSASPGMLSGMLGMQDTQSAMLRLTQGQSMCSLVLPWSPHVLQICKHDAALSVHHPIPGKKVATVGQVMKQGLL